MPDVWWYARRGEWCADVPSMENSQKRVRLYFGSDKKTARQQLHTYLAGFYADGPSSQASTGKSPLSLFALTARFLSWSETNLSKATQDVYRRQLKAFVERHGHRPAAQITPSDVEERKAAIRRAGNKARTINFFVQSIKRLYNWAVEQGLLADNPIRAVKKVPRDPPRDKSLDDDVVERFLEIAATSQPLGDFCELLLLTGMRAGEILHLKWENVDFGQGVARVFEHKTAHRGEQRPRTIPLSPRAIEIIQRQPEGSEFVFTNEEGRQLSYNALRCRRKRFEKKHPELPKITFHQFRHTFATRLARNGVPERVAQEILGHSSTLMTRYYTTTPISEMLDAVEKVSREKSQESQS